MRISGGLRFGVMVAAAAGFAAQSYAFPSENYAAERVRDHFDDPPTYSKDVAPILQQTCIRCHSEDGVAPMPLTTYEEVRQFATLIKDRVVKRIMPPYHVDPTIGIQDYKNDVRLSREEINTIVQWVDSGTPEGDPADLPPPVEWPAWDEWWLEAELGPPDVVLKTDPITVSRLGRDMWPSQRVEWEGFETLRYVRADEIRNTVRGRSSLHHLVVFHRQEGGGGRRLSSMGVGKRWDMYSDDVGLPIPPGPAQISWSLHYFPKSEEIVDTVQVALWFYPEGYVPELAAEGEVRYLVDQFDSGQPRGRSILIPPKGSLTLNRAFLLDQPMLIHSFVPHMHKTGIGLSMEAILPDKIPDGWGAAGSSRVVLTSVNNYNHNWQNDYVYADYSRPLLPAGTVLLLHSQFDNSDKNPLVVDPDQWITFGARSVDAMSNARMSVTNLTEAEYERLIEERMQFAKEQIAKPKDQRIDVWLAPEDRKKLEMTGSR